MNEEPEEFNLTPAEQLELSKLEASMKAEAPIKQETEVDFSNGMSYADIYASVLLNGEIIIEIPSDIVEKVKMGLRNHKARQLAKLKAAEQVVDDTVLSFTSTYGTDNPDIIALVISLRERTAVPVLKLTIPDGAF